MDTNDEFELQSFFPYLVRVFYSEVTSAISGAYQNDYAMSRTEWRAMSILGVNNSLTANEIVVRSSMDKVTVSRAVARLKKNGWIEVTTNIDDGRSKLLSLSDVGKNLYLEIVPKVLEVERKLLSGISEAQKVQFIRIMEKIKKNKNQYFE